MKKKPSLTKPFSEKDLLELEETTIANIIEKVTAGGVPSAREQAILATAARKKADAEESAANFVQNWNELADALPIDRRTLQNFRNEHAELIQQKEKEL